jgi:hypothetical protein
MSPVAYPAPVRLADLAEEMRPDWPRALFEGALTEALRSWSWPKVYGEVSRLLVDPDSSPRDLTVAVEGADPVLSRKPADPDRTRQYAADCRALLALTRERAS